MFSLSPIKEETSLGGKAARSVSKGTLAVVGGAAGVLAGSLNRPANQAIGAFKEGQWSVPEYRRASQQKDSQSARASQRGDQAKPNGGTK